MHNYFIILQLKLQNKNLKVDYNYMPPKHRHYHHHYHRPPFHTRSLNRKKPLTYNCEIYINKAINLPTTMSPVKNTYVEIQQSGRIQRSHSIKENINPIWDSIDR